MINRVQIAIPTIVALTTDFGCFRGRDCQNEKASSPENAFCAQEMLIQEFLFNILTQWQEE